MKKRFNACYIGGKDLGMMGREIFNRYSDYFEEQDDPYGCDYLFNLFGDKIFSPEVLESVHMGAINFHYGQLPMYRGRFIVSHLINNGEKKTCATAHHITKEIDKGDIIFEKWVTIKSRDTARSLYNKCTHAALTLFEKVLEYIIKGDELPRKKQKGRGHYYPNKPLNNDLIDLTWSKEKIERFIRATTFPPFYPYLIIKGVQYYVKNSDLDTKL